MLGQITGLTGADLLTALIVVLVIFEVINLVGKTLQTIQGWKKPVDQQRDKTQSRLKSCEDKLHEDNNRLNDIESGQHMLCRGMLALLSHEINGNSVDKLRKAQDELTNFLIER